VAQLVVRDLESDVKTKLQRRARQHGRSMEEEVRSILRQAVATGGQVAQGLGSQIAERFRGIGLTADMPELRAEEPRPAVFDQPPPGLRPTSE
jgi:plasmid stability protein